jgi:DNA topoisomerase-1
MGRAKTRREAERNIIAAVDLTAKRLGNTRSVCRKYYIHPALIEAYLDGSVLPPTPERKWSKRKSRGPTLRQHETDVLNFIKSRLKPQKRRLAASHYKKPSELVPSEPPRPESPASEIAVIEPSVPEPREDEDLEPTGS